MLKSIGDLCPFWECSCYLELCWENNSNGWWCQPFCYDA